MPPCGKGIYIRWQHLIFFYLCTWFSCIKKIGQSCICWAVGSALQSNSSSCLVLIPHRQFGNFVLNALLGEFSNIDSIYKFYKPTIWSAVQLLKTESEFKKLPLPENLQSNRSLLGRCTKMANRHSYHKRYTGNEAMCKTTNAGTGHITGDSSPCHIYPKHNKICSPSEKTEIKWDDGYPSKVKWRFKYIFNITEVLTQCIRHQQIYIYMCTILV